MAGKRGRIPLKLAPKIVRLLGQVTDKEVAERAGVSRYVAARRREELGIPKCKRRGTTKIPAEFLNRLGKEPDERIAEEAGVTKSRVQQIRVDRNIPSFRSTLKQPTPPPKKSAKPGGTKKNKSKKP